MKFKQLIKSIGSYTSDSNFGDFQVRGISCNSKNVQDNFVFVAISGTHEDGHRFIEEAISKGAKTVIVKSQIPNPKSQNKINIIRVEDTRKVLARLAAEFYGNPSSKIKVVGITGTNGKTTITYLIEAILKEAGFNPAVIGTVNYRFKDKVIPAKNTTPGQIELQSMLADMLKQGADYAVVEVSSHALDQDRIGWIDFHSSIFTNLTQDHLDYHISLENYFQAKSKLFRSLSPNAFAVINNDNTYAGRIKESTRARIITYGIDNKSDLTAKDIKFDITHTEFSIIAREGEFSASRYNEFPLKTGKAGSRLLREKIKSRLIGRYNVYNILASICWAIAEGVNLRIIKSAIEKFYFVPGRLERIECNGGFSVFVDYAHTEDALTNVIKALRTLSRSKIIVVFGCGGERDKTKRPKMGGVVTELADYAIITNDNPRSENPQDIINDIKKGIKKENFCVIAERLEAIKRALKVARPQDIVLIAGKGHENYQVLNNRIEHFDDREVVRKCLRQMNY